MNACLMIELAASIIEREPVLLMGSSFRFHSSSRDRLTPDILLLVELQVRPTNGAVSCEGIGRPHNA